MWLMRDEKIEHKENDRSDVLSLDMLYIFRYGYLNNA